MKYICALFLALSLLTGCSIADRQTAADGTPSQASLAAQELIDRARSSVETLSNDKDLAGVAELLPKAKGVMIFPKLVKGGFIIGAQGGEGVVLIRDANGQWSNPAFYNMIGGSFGLQIGVESTEALFLVMTDKGLENILKNQFKLGADVSVALGPVGAGLGASKSAFDLAADMIVYAKTSGLYTGGAFNGTGITVRDDLNEAYYQTKTEPATILKTNDLSNPGADRLRAALNLSRDVPNPKAVPIVPVESY